MNNFNGKKREKSGLRTWTEADHIHLRCVSNAIQLDLYTSDVVFQINDANGSECGQLHQHKN